MVWAQEAVLVVDAVSDKAIDSGAAALVDGSSLVLRRVAEYLVEVPAWLEKKVAKMGCPNASDFVGARNDILI